MIPSLLEYEEGIVKITANAFSIPEVNAIIKKFPKNSESYLQYLYCKTSPDSPYVNIPEDERDEIILFDIQETLGDFNSEEPLLVPALEKLELLYTSTAKRYRDSLKVSIDKMSLYLRDQPIVAGKDGNLSEIIRIHKEGAATIRNFKDIEKQVDEEIAIKMKGDQEMGMY